MVASYHASLEKLPVTRCPDTHREGNNIPRVAPGLIDMLFWYRLRKSPAILNSELVNGFPPTLLGSIFV